MLYIRAMLLLFSCAAVLAADKAALPDFSKYPQSDSFCYYLGFHTGRRAEKYLQNPPLLMISAFLADGLVLQYFVSMSGQELDHRKVYSWADQMGRQQQLTEINLRDLHSALRELPKESVLPPIERMIIVSFRDDADWVTRCYDSNALPKAVSQIYEIIGEREESKKSQ